MAGDGWSKGPVCGIENCRSRYYEEGEDGYNYCQNGHRQGDTLVRGEDEDDYNPLARKHRLKTGQGEEKTFQYFQGQQGFDLYLKSLQLILRHQVWFLMKSKDLPVELEQVVLDLWALRIQKLESQVADNDADDSQSQTFTISDTEEESGKEQQSSFRSSRRGMRMTSSPNLLDSLALCYMGMMALRLPITLGDIHAWIISGEMVYTRAIKAVPENMRERLPARYHARLDPTSFLKEERLFSTILDLTASYENTFGATFPALNYHPILFRYLRELALPLEVFEATKRLTLMLDYKFEYPNPKMKKVTLRNIPEAQLIAALIVCVKLMYPFDGVKRYPKTVTEPAAVAIDWDDWVTQINAKRFHQNSTNYTNEELAKIQAGDVFTMSGDQLDQYLDWYQRTWIDESALEKDNDFQQALYKQFPINRTVASPALGEASSSTGTPDDNSTHTSTDTIKAIHAKMKPRTVIEEGDENGRILRPGGRYKHYREEKDLPGAARIFYKKAASISGLSLKMLINAVFFTEKKMEKLITQKRRESGE